MAAAEDEAGAVELRTQSEGEGAEGAERLTEEERRERRCHILTTCNPITSACGFYAFQETRRGSGGLGGGVENFESAGAPRR